MDDRQAPMQNPTGSGIEGTLGAILSDPALMERISGVIKGEATPNEADGAGGENRVGAPVAGADGISSVLSDPAMMQKLPQVMAMLAPLMNGSKTAQGSERAEGSGTGNVRDKKCQRDDLLLALKPFLSPARCEAIDMLLRISRLGNALQNFK